MEPADLLITPRWLLPIAPANIALEGHAVAVAAGRIVARRAGRAARGPVRCAGAHFARLARVLPGFVNAHTRASMALMRGLRVHAPVLRWQRETIGPPNAREPGLRARRHAARHRGDAACGHHGFRRLVPVSRRGRARRGRSAHACGHRPARLRDAELLGAELAAHLDRAAQLVGRVPRGSLGFARISRRRHAVTPSTTRRSPACAASPMSWMRASPCPCTKPRCEVQDSVGQHGLRPLQRLAKLGLLRPGFTAVHMNHLEPSDIELARHSGLSVVACPQADLRLGSGSCPVSALLAARRSCRARARTAPIASGAFDMLAEARLARAAGGCAGGSQRDGCAAARQPWAAQWRSASASDFGSIEPGKAADLVCIDLCCPRLRAPRDRRGRACCSAPHAREVSGCVDRRARRRDELAAARLRRQASCGAGEAWADALNQEPSHEHCCLFTRHVRCRGSRQIRRARAPLLGSERRIQAAAHAQPGARKIRRGARAAADARVLDVGCGGGLLCEAVTRARR